jgi:DNA-binding CsgD family transcriptional regulator
MAEDSTCKELKQRLRELKRENERLRKAENHLIESGKEKEVILNSMVELVTYKDLEMKILWANQAACESVNLTYEELLGRYCYEIWEQRDDICPNCKVNKSMKIGKPQRMEKCTYDGRSWLIWAYPIRGASGEIERMVQIALNTSEIKQAKKALRKREKELEIQSQHLQEVNTALKVLLKHRENDQKELQESVAASLEKLIFPYLEKLKGARLDNRYREYIKIIESNLNDINSPFIGSLSSKDLKLTQKEIQVANLVKMGKTSKEISELLNVTPGAIEFHRNNIRKKFGIIHKKINLRTYLLSIQ